LLISKVSSCSSRQSSSAASRECALSKRCHLVDIEGVTLLISAKLVCIPNIGAAVSRVPRVRPFKKVSPCRYRRCHLVHSGKARLHPQYRGDGKRRPEGAPPSKRCHLVDTEGVTLFIAAKLVYIPNIDATVSGAPRVHPPSKRCHLVDAEGVTLLMPKSSVTSLISRRRSTALR